MKKNGFIRATALTNVVGRIDYISNPKRQEHLVAFYDNMPANGWKELSKISRAQASYNAGKKVCEARELIVMIPNEMAKYKPDQVAKVYADQFTEQYGVPCSAAIHWNKKKNNYHAHLVFSEREILKEQKVSIATRNTYFDAQGKRSSKKLCVGSDGKLLPGCRFVAKGENLSEPALFSSKYSFFARPDWLRAEKQRQIAFVNKYITGEKWQVYDWKSNPHLPYIRTQKGEPAGLRAWKERENDRRREFNESIDKLLTSGELTSEQALELKYEYIRRSRELKKARMAARELWVKEWKGYSDRRRAEYEYMKSLRNKSTLALACELALMIAGVDMVKLKTGIEKTAPSGRTIKVYPDKRVQAMIDDMYIAAGKKTPSELALMRKAERLTHQQDGDLSSLISAAEKNKEDYKKQIEHPGRETPTDPDDR